MPAAGGRRHWSVKNGRVVVVVVMRGDPSSVARVGLVAAAAAGSFRTAVGTSHPRIQIHTIQDHFDRRVLNLPTLAEVAVGERDRTEASGRQRSLDDGDGDD